MAGISPAFSASGMSTLGRHQPPARVGPAQKGLDASDAPVAGGDDGLVVEVQLASP